MSAVYKPLSVCYFVIATQTKTQEKMIILENFCLPPSGFPMPTEIADGIAFVVHECDFLISCKKMYQLLKICILNEPAVSEAPNHCYKIMH